MEAADLRGDSPDQAYGAVHYWQKLRPLEYAGPMAVACDNLIGRRCVFLAGGWGPELGVDCFWQELAKRIAPAQLTVIHLDAPNPETWRARLRKRGSRCDSPYFEQLAQNTGQLPVWKRARRINTERPQYEVVQGVLNAL